MPPAPPPDSETVQLADQAAWEAWLEANHAASPGVWLRIAKRGTKTATVTHPEALQTALCFGWIDAQRRGLDETFFLQRFTPRRPRSRWSLINRRSAERLIADGRMRAAGLAQVHAAQADGRWDAAYAPQSSATVPPDLQQALDADPAAGRFFTTLTGARRYAFLFRLHNVKTPEARRRRIASYIDLLRQGRTLN